ncbi:MAG TPA: hypothetical protein VGS12_02775 [Caulobacteraceae bacterium]|nr:hypothetical protein [Caulobacteraceae bacterium]
MRRSAAALVAAIALAAGLSGCETATPYQPMAHGTKVWGGFTDQRIEPDRYRVTFQGNSVTSRKTVETYLLYRAAELTTAQGYDWFEAAERHTDRSVETYVEGDPFFYWHPYWRFYGGFRHHAFGGWSGWGPWWGDPFWGPDFDVQTIERYEASIEIVMHHGPKPAGDARAFDAHAVVANLGPTIVRPS